MAENYMLAAPMIEAEAREKIKEAQTTEDKLRAAFATAHDHWMFTDEQDQFKGGIGAVMIQLKDGPEFERLRRSVEELSKVSALLHALQNGVAVDIEAMLAEQNAQTDRDTLIPLRNLWHETGGER